MDTPETLIYFAFALILIAIILKILVSAKKKRNLNEAKRDSLISKYEDLSALIYILLSEKESGVPMFHKAFGENSDLDEKSELLSGFIHAVSIMGKEIGSKYGLSRNEYQDRVIIVIGGEFCRFITVFNQPPSTETENSLLLFLKKFEKKFHSKFRNYKGEQFHYDEVKEILDSTLETYIVDELKPFFTTNEIDRHLGLAKSILEFIIKMDQNNEKITFPTILNKYCLEYEIAECYDVEHKPELFKLLVNFFHDGYLIRKE